MEDFTAEGVDLTSQFSKLPWSSRKEVVYTFRDESDHEQEVRHSQVHNEHVGWCTKSLIVAENPQYDNITEDGDGSCKLNHR